MKKFLTYRVLFSALLIISSRVLAQQPVTLTLRINYGATAKVFHDEPIILTVAISNQAAQENQQWNKAADRRLKQLDVLLNDKKINQEDYNKQKEKLIAGKKPVLTHTLGTEAIPWLQLVKWKLGNAGTGVETILPVRPLVNPSSDAVAVLDENGYYMAYFGISPDDMTKISAARYSLTAMLDKESSNVVNLEIKNETMPVSVSENEEILLKMGQYYWHLNDPVKTIYYADRILKKSPYSLDGLSLKADGQVLQQSYLPALENYNKAVKEYYKLNGAGSEPPEYLFSMIAFVKKELGQ